MYQTTCIIDDKEIPMDFSKASTKDGELYSGVLFKQPLIEFSFTIDFTDTVLPPFFPADTALSTQAAILQSIREYNIEPGDSGSSFFD